MGRTIATSPNSAINEGHGCFCCGNVMCCFSRGMLAVAASAAAVFAVVMRVAASSLPDVEVHNQDTLPSDVEQLRRFVGLLVVGIGSVLLLVSLTPTAAVPRLMRVLAQATSEAAVLQAKDAAGSKQHSNKAPHTTLSTSRSSEGCCSCCADQGYFCMALCGRCRSQRSVHPADAAGGHQDSPSSCMHSVRDAFTVHPGSIQAWLAGQTLVPDSKLMLHLMQTFWWAGAVPVVVIGVLWLSSPLDPSNDIQVMVEDMVVADGFRVWLWSGPILLRLMDDMLWEMEQFSSQGTPEDGGDAQLQEASRRRGCCSAVLHKLGTWQGLLLMSLGNPVVRIACLFIPVEGLFVPLGVFTVCLTLLIQITVGTTKRSTIMRALFALVLPVDIIVMLLAVFTAFITTNRSLTVVMGRAHSALISIEYTILLPVMVYVLHLAAGARRALSLLQFLRYISHEVRVPTNVCMLALEESLDLLEPVAAALPQLQGVGVLPASGAGGGLAIPGAIMVASSSRGSSRVAMPAPVASAAGVHSTSLLSQAHVGPAVVGPLPSASPSARVGGVALAAASLDTASTALYPSSVMGSIAMPVSDSSAAGGGAGSLRHRQGVKQPIVMSGASSSDLSSTPSASQHTYVGTPVAGVGGIAPLHQGNAHGSRSGSGSLSSSLHGTSSVDQSVSGRRLSTPLPPTSPTARRAGGAGNDAAAGIASTSRKMTAPGPSSMSRMYSSPVGATADAPPGTHLLQPDSITSAAAAPGYASTLSLPSMALAAPAAAAVVVHASSSSSAYQAAPPAGVGSGTTSSSSSSDPAVLSALQRDVMDTIGMLQDGRSALEQLQSLLNRTLDLAKLEAGRTSINRMVFPLDKLWRAIRNAVAPAYSALGVRLDMELDLGAASGQYVLADMLRIQQAVVNVLHNGAKYSPKGTTVTARLVMGGVGGEGEDGEAPRVTPPRKPHLRSTGLVQSGMSSILEESLAHSDSAGDNQQVSGVPSESSAGEGGSKPSGGTASTGSGSAGVARRAQDSWITITIADQGRGMTPQEQLDVFIPFSRLHSGKEGTGLGLNIAKRAMQAHGGDLTVHSPGLGKGCTFTCEVPVSIVHRSDIPASVLSATAGDQSADGRSVSTWQGGSVQGGVALDAGMWHMSSRNGKHGSPPGGASESDPPPTALSSTPDAKQGGAVNPLGAHSMLDDTSTPSIGSPQAGTGGKTGKEPHIALPVGAAHQHSLQSQSSAGDALALQQAALSGHAVSRFSKLSSMAVEQPQLGASGADATANVPAVVPDSKDSPSGGSHSGGSTLSDSGMCVLVVDDDKATRRMLARVVARFPLVRTVLTANDGAKAVEMVQQQQLSGAPITHITMDNQMPVMTGQEAVRTLREQGCTARVVGLTGNVVGNDRRDFIAAGADDVLGKPVQRGDLMKALFRPGHE